jgi:hypothetical protein
MASVILLTDILVAAITREDIIVIQNIAANGAMERHAIIRTVCNAIRTAPVAIPSAKLKIVESATATALVLQRAVLAKPAAMGNVTILMRMKVAAITRQNIIRIRKNAAAGKSLQSATQLNANPATAVAEVVKFVAAILQRNAMKVSAVSTPAPIALTANIIMKTPENVKRVLARLLLMHN